MWFKKLIANTQWSHFSDYLSPAFFDVVSHVAIAKVAGQLTRSAVDVAGFQNATEKLNVHLQSHGLRVRLRSQSSDDRSSRSDIDFEEILRLYFFQIYFCESSFLDFSRSTFSEKGGLVYWNPNRVWYKWDEDFILSVRNLYEGFYTGQNDLFVSALGSLGLSAAESAFRQHFGSSQDNHKFDLRQFQDSFHQVFVAARDSGSRVHSNFLPFGLGLATLYHCLSESSQGLNVRKAYFDVYRMCHQNRNQALSTDLF